MARPSKVYIISISAHLGIGVAVAAIPAKKVLETYQVMVADSRKKPDVPKPNANPPLAPTTPAKVPSARARSAARPAANAAATPVTDAAGSGYVPDFGLALGNFSGDEGIAVPVARARVAEQPPPSVKRALVARPQPRAASLCDEALVKAKLVSIRQPQFTEQARTAGIAGRLRLKITLDEQGNVTQIALIQGLGYGLDEAAIAAAKAAKFQPATRCGKPIASTFNFAVRFGG